MVKDRNTIFIVVTLFVMVSFVANAQQQYMAYEPFLYQKGKAIDQTTGTSGYGWLGNWQPDSKRIWGTGCNAFISQYPLQYSDLLYPVPNAGNHVSVYVPGGWSGAISFKRQLDRVWPNEAGKVYWTSHVFDIEPAPADEWCYFLFKLFYFGEDTTELFAVGKGGGTKNYTCGSGWPGAGPSDDIANVLCEGGPVWLVTATYMLGGGRARTFMWINPDPSIQPDTASANVKRWTNAPKGFNHVVIECGGGDSAIVNYDEIKLGLSYEAVALPIPLTDVESEQVVGVPRTYELSNNYPNPFNPTTQFRYSIPKSCLLYTS
ncbi:MAG: hypothetical protein N3A63_09385, partial [Bacteroidetes bacterium]|nr:hypothetical protein [Bacteroidota bacterium]